MLEIVNQLDGFDSRGNVKAHHAQFSMILTMCYSDVFFLVLAEVQAAAVF